MRELGDLLSSWVGILVGAFTVVAAVTGFFNRQSKRRGHAIEARLKDQINGVGTRVGALELTVGSHETTLDSHDLTLRDSARDRQLLFAQGGELKNDLEKLREVIEHKESLFQHTLTNIQVDIGKLSSKVDILLEDRQ